MHCAYASCWRLQAAYRMILSRLGRRNMSEARIFCISSDKFRSTTKRIRPWSANDCKLMALLASYLQPKTWWLLTPNWLFASPLSAPHQFLLSPRPTYFSTIVLTVQNRSNILQKTSIEKKKPQCGRMWKSPSSLCGKHAELKEFQFLIRKADMTNFLNS